MGRLKLKIVGIGAIVLFLSLGTNIAFAQKDNKKVNQQDLKKENKTFKDKDVSEGRPVDKRKFDDKAKGFLDNRKDMRERRGDMIERKRDWRQD